MNYTSQKDYKQKIKARTKWSKVNDYEVYNFASCMICRHFKLDAAHPFHGDCGLMEKEQAYNGVMVDAVCNRFLSTKGTDINGKQVDPDALSFMFKVEKLGDGSVYLPRDKSEYYTA